MTLRNLKSGKKAVLRIAALGLASLSLSGCVYDMGLGYYDNGYSNYDCDPYSPWDSYYSCDYGYGFSNIGYGGGWFDNFYYPGYGVYIFDSYGSRYNMRDNHRRYWSNQRYDWQRSRGGRGHGGYDQRGYDQRGHDQRGDNQRGRGHHDQGRGQYQGAANQPIGWPEQHGGRTDERPGRGRNPGNQGWGNNQGGNNQGAVGAAPPPQPRQDGVRPDYPRNDGYGRGDRGPRGGQPGIEQRPAGAVQPAPEQSGRGYGRRGYGRGGDGGQGAGSQGGGGGYAPAPQRAAPAPQAAPPPSYVPQSAPPPQPRSEPREERPARVERRDRVDESGE